MCANYNKLISIEKQLMIKKQVLMVAHPALEPKVRILTIFYPLQSFDLSPKHKLSKIHLYTKEAVYEAFLQGEHINSQLGKDQESFFTIIQALNGERSQIGIFFREQQGNQLSLTCEIKTGNNSCINITLFTLPMKKLSKQKPFSHMRRVFGQVHQEYLDDEKRLAEKRADIQRQENEITALGKYIQDSNAHEMDHMKTNFLKIINSVKGKTRKYFQEGIEEAREEDDNDNSNSNSYIVRQIPKLPNGSTNETVVAKEETYKDQIYSLFD